VLLLQFAGIHHSGQLARLNATTAFAGATKFCVTDKLANCQLNVLFSISKSFTLFFNASIFSIISFQLEAFNVSQTPTSSISFQFKVA
jgi:hypothetical protein